MNLEHAARRFAGYDEKDTPAEPRRSAYTDDPAGDVAYRNAVERHIRYRAFKAAARPEFPIEEMIVTIHGQHLKPGDCLIDHDNAVIVRRGTNPDETPGYQEWRFHAEGGRMFSFWRDSKPVRIVKRRVPMPPVSSSELDQLRDAVKTLDAAADADAGNHMFGSPIQLQADVLRRCVRQLTEAAEQVAIDQQVPV